MDDVPITRRTLLVGAAAAAGGAVLRVVPTAAQQPTGTLSASPAPLADPTRVPGAPTAAVGQRSSFVHPARAPVGKIDARAPLQELSGTMTPSDLHFTRVHAGTPAIDPGRHTLLIHGLVDHPIELSVADLKRYPSVTRVAFIECAGNGIAAYRIPKPEMTPQDVDGMISQSEWTGVPLATLLEEVGARPEASWFLAEGSDAALVARSIPIAKAHEDAIVAWGQNGEPLRPEQGFPIRLLLPGYEGNANIKWLRRIKLGTAPFMTEWETSKYTEPLPGGTIRQFSFEMDTKSIITSPGYPERLSERGWWPIRGVAWSGRGRIARVEVSTDAGAHWSTANLLTPTAPKAMVSFEHMWHWDGDNALLMSRATDEHGYVQPTMAELMAARGPGATYHFNSIRGWRVARSGVVTFEAHT